MLKIESTSRTYWSDLERFCQGSVVSDEISASVTAILADVRKNGDAAVTAYAKKFDGADLKPEQFKVEPAEIKAAFARISAGERQALKAAHASIALFQPPGQNPGAGPVAIRRGPRVGEKFDPIRRVGLYVPGGQVPLVSTVLMTATLATIAGCPEIAVCTPCGPDGRIADGLLAALHLAGVSEVYRIGGVQAVGAMAFGTGDDPPSRQDLRPGQRLRLRGEASGLRGGRGRFAARSERSDGDR